MEFSYKAKETVIAIAGVGGGGGNAINYMKEKGIEKVKFIAFNTDFQDLYNKSEADLKVELGKEGLGAGANPEVAREAAENSKKEIEKQLELCDMVFITAGMGGGTGTGASPVIAKIARDLGKLTVAIVTKPFRFEGNKKMKVALKGIEELKKYVDSIIVIPNQKLFKIGADTNLTAIDMYKMVNEVLRIGVKSITDLITTQSQVNLDFNDVKAILSNGGISVFGFGVAAAGEDPIVAVEQAMHNPLLEKSILGAKNILVNITMNPNFSAIDYEKITTEIEKKFTTGEDEDMIHGVTLDPEVENVQISIIASNFDDRMADQNEIEYKSKEFNQEEDKEIYNLLLPKY